MFEFDEGRIDEVMDIHSQYLPMQSCTPSTGVLTVRTDHNVEAQSIYIFLQLLWQRRVQQGGDWMLD